MVRRVQSSEGPLDDGRAWDDDFDPEPAEMKPSKKPRSRSLKLKKQISLMITREEYRLLELEASRRSSIGTKSSGTSSRPVYVTDLLREVLQPLLEQLANN
ncbi:hypothetical protein KOR42_10510 [Thalassoglobus neptunius]|uniref:Uncharacterized protein n=1 Tax=Thalassoglobus neptunius TaxID=1938619 RepID=A0A5C5WG16_9PLAN|nr:hypothetical protein [Thalassoglobus neptunius]TWT49039.1 hypothetical protein KOR42_39550 [Thalassoglobus neptunius]TWT57687.1 hypothetical protein KOR42_10510 [Thalassoglobus neptunius]